MRSGRRLTTVACIFSLSPPVCHTAQASDVLSLMLKAQAAAANGGAPRKKGAALLEAAKGYIPPLTDLFVVGQFVRCVVVEASSDAQNVAAAAYKEEGGSARVRIYLSLLLKEVQGGLGAEALVEGTALGAVVRSVEDHGYTLSFGIKVCMWVVGEGFGVKGTTAKSEPEV